MAVPAPRPLIPVDLTKIEKLITDQGWTSFGIQYGELQFETEPGVLGIVDENGHLAFNFYSSWAFIECVRLIIFGPLLDTGSPTEGT